MAGEEDSFASYLLEQGYEPECILRGLGEYPAIREIYTTHLRTIMGRLYKDIESGEHKGILYGIGVGPGDPELVTQKAIRTIETCNLLVLPAVSRESCYAYQIALQVCPDIENKATLCMPFPMTRDEQKVDIAHNQIYQDIEDSLRQGQKVGLLTIGDPSVYSTYLYMHKRALEAGWQSHIISGVPSFCAVAARLGISLGEKNEEIHIIPASYEIEDTLSYHGTRVYMKSGRKLRELIEALRADERTADCEIYGVSNCGMENERVYHGLDKLAEVEGYLTTVIVKPR
jgi:sirohydrochlorin cobaltochelatase